MNKTDTTIAGERTRTGDRETHSEMENHELTSDTSTPGSERGGYLFNGKTAKEWFNEKEELRLDYGRAIKELEGQDAAIRKHEVAAADKLRKTSPQGVKR